MWIIIACMVIVLVLLIVNCVLIYLAKHNFKPSSLGRFCHIPNECKIVAIGSGPCVYGFDESLNPSASLNLGIAPQGLKHDFKMFDTFAGQFDSVEYLVHFIAPLSFGENKYMEEDQYKLKYCPFLSRQKCEVSFRSYTFEKYFPIKNQSIESLKAALYEKIKQKDKTSKITEPEKINKDRIYSLVAGWLRDNPAIKDLKSSQMESGANRYFQDNVRWLRSFDEKCNALGIQHILVIAPMSEYLREYFSDSFLEVFLYDGIKKAGIPESNVIDFLKISDMQNNSLYQPNGLFLNSEGSRLITKKIYKEIEKRQLTINS